MEFYVQWSFINPVWVGKGIILESVFLCSTSPNISLGFPLSVPITDHWLERKSLLFAGIDLVFVLRLIELPPNPHWLSELQIVSCWLTEVQIVPNGVTVSYTNFSQYLVPWPTVILQTVLLCTTGKTSIVVAVGTLYLVQPLGLPPLLLVVLVVLLVPPLLLDNFQASFRGELPPIFAALSDRRYRPFHPPWSVWPVERVSANDKGRCSVWEGKVATHMISPNMPRLSAWQAWQESVGPFLACVATTLDLCWTCIGLVLNWCVLVCNLGLHDDPTDRLCIRHLVPLRVAARTPFCDANVGCTLDRIHHMIYRMHIIAQQDISYEI